MATKSAESGPPRLKTAFRKARVIAPLHTGGPFAVTSDSKRIVTCVREEAILTQVSTGAEICRFSGDASGITSLALNPSNTQLVVFFSSLSLRVYDIPIVTSRQPVQANRHIPRAQEAPAHVCRFDPSSLFLASGAADGVVKVWDIRRGYVTHVLKGHGGVVSALLFYIHPATEKILLFTASVDTRIRIFNLSAPSSRTATAKPQAVLEGHVSVPRALSISADGRWLLSGGRDSVVMVWNLLGPPTAKGAKDKGKDKEYSPLLAKTIPILERVEVAGILEGDGKDANNSRKLMFFTGGEKGVIRIWEAWEGQVLRTFGENHTSQHLEEQREIVDAFYSATASTVISLHADQNILFHDLTTSSLSHQLIGFNDEITDAVFLSPVTGSPDSHLALATNSSLIRVYSTSNLDARLLSGHTDMVLCIDKSNCAKLLVSGSKDKTARIWAAYSDSPSEFGCVAKCEGHTSSVGAIAMSRRGGKNGGAQKFMFTGSQDKTIKMWDLSSLPSGYSTAHTLVRLKSLTTHKAHDKDINSLDVSANDRLLATGSQDKTAKVFEIEYISLPNGVIRGEIKVLGICKGHKRGVWNVRFGATERVLATGSGDKSVKLWNLDDFTCLKTFEGHTNSVLRVEFVSQGAQLMTAASDGLVKLWNVKEEECVATMDNHEEKVWALALASDNKTVVSAGADSVVTFWEDCTEEEKLEKENKRAELVLREQDFANFLSLHDYRNAILLALAMDHPGRLLSLLKTVIASRSGDEPSITGNLAVDMVIKNLGSFDLTRLLRHVRTWNTSSRSSPIAQIALYAILKLRSADDIRGAFNSQISAVEGENQFRDVRMTIAELKDPISLKDIIDGLVPYTERHLNRADRMVQESYIVDYILGEMDNGLFENEDVMDVEGTRV